MKIALNNKWKWCIVFRAFFIWIWSPRIFQFSYSPMSNSLTSENMERGFAHRIFDKLCLQMDGIWSIIILNFVPMENCLLKIFYWSIGAKLGCRGRIFFFSLLPDKFSPHCTAPFLVAWKHVFYSFEVLTKYCANCMSHPIKHNNSQYNNYTTDERIPFTWWSVFPHRGLFVYVD